MTVDFDELKRDYLAAVDRLDELAAAGPERRALPLRRRSLHGRAPRPCRARLAGQREGARKNKAYAASVDYVSKCIDHIYGGAYGFAQLDEQLKFLKRRLPRIYYYALQVFWSSYDCASGYAYAKTIATRHLAFISHILKEMGFSSLDRFLDDTIGIAGRLSASAEKRDVGTSVPTREITSRSARS